jgi:polysaccharide export outer membrane protein
VTGAIKKCSLATIMLLAAPAVLAQQPTSIAGASSGSARPAGTSSSSSGGGKTSGGTLSAVPEDFANIRIAPGFLLDVEVYDEPELSGELRVDDAGNIAFPLAGSIHVTDSTLAEARRRIQERLISEQILLHPQIMINIEQYAPFVVAVIGEVQTPGRVQLLAPHPLLDVLSQVGGETAMAGNAVEVRHSADGHLTVDRYPYGRNSDGSSIEKVILHGGDTVIVPRAGIVYVLGAVNRPGGYLMQEDGKLDVAQALSLATGTSLVAAVRSIRVIRRNSDGTYVEYPVDYKAISEGKQKPLYLQAQDIVYVPVSKLKTALTSGVSLIDEATYATIYTAHP